MTEPASGVDARALAATALRLRQDGRWSEMVKLLQPQAARPAPEPRLNALLSDAWLLGGREPEAAAALAPVLDRGGDDDFVQASLARLKLRQGDRAGAEAAAARALALNPGDPEHQVLVAALMSVAGRVDEALAAVERTLAAHPGCASAHARRAMLLLSLARRPEALVAARAAAAAGFHHPDAWRLHHSVGDRPAAIEALRRRLAADPDDSLAMVALADLLRAAGKTEEATTWFARAVAARPADPKAWAGYGTALQAAARTDAARDAYRKAHALSPGDDGLAVNLAAMEHRAGRYEAVIQALDPIVAAGRGTVPVHLTLGKAAVRLGRDAQAAAHFDAVLRLEPANAEALRSLGRTAEEAAVWRDRAQAGLLTLDELQDWLQLLASEPSLGDPLAAYEAFAGAVRPNPRELARLTTYPLIARWAAGDMATVSRLVSHKAALRVEEAADEQPHRFFHYVDRLAAFRALRPELYAGEATVDEVQVIGESHALSPANLLGRWRGRPVRFRSRFIMGVKMFSLASAGSTFYSAHLAAYLAGVGPGADLIFAIGEIDCRPDEGIWAVRRRGGQTADAVAASTVAAYLEALDRRLAAVRPAAVTLQGVPAPGYDVAAKLQSGERVEDFLDMIRDVNARLRQGALQRGWGFLDTWSATAGADGLGNRMWHIDGYHLSPAFYIEAADAVRRS